LAQADDHPYRNDEMGENEHEGHSHAGSNPQAHFWKEIHETLMGISLFLIGLHICGVIASSYVHRENLILAMITGRKKIP
jgi:cytochrome b